MSHTKYTGKSAATTITFGALTLPGWRKITIQETGRPLPTPIDTTVAGDTAYAFTDDPLGGKTSPSSTVTVTGLLSLLDFSETQWLALAIDASDTLTVTTASGGDEWANTMTFKTFVPEAPHDGAVAYTATFVSTVSAGVWSTDS